MKALSTRQPWAQLIVDSIKDIENRNWSTKYRGEIFIHASKMFDYEGYDFILKEFPDVFLKAPDAYPRGGVVGTAKIVDCVTEHESRWFFGKYGFVMSEPHNFPFYKCKGKLGLFNLY